MPLFTQNRQTPTQRGAGLPFLTSTEYQERNKKVTDSDPLGYWQTPQNRMPSFQVWSLVELVAFRYIRIIDGVPQAPVEININLLKKVEVFGDSTYYIYYVRDVEIEWFWECGFYYLELDFGTYSWYSEVFAVAGVCAVGFGVSYSITSVNMDDSANVLFTINEGTGNATSFINSVNLTPNYTQSFIAILPLGNNVVGVSMQTPYCGTYAQTYNIENLGSGNLVFTREIS